jgi:hypothetical protein
LSRGNEYIAIFILPVELLNDLSTHPLSQHRRLQ